MPGPGTALPLRPFLPEDRVLLGDFTRVNALASSFDQLFVVYPMALVIYRPIEHRWEVPRAPYDPTLLRTVHAAVIDESDQSVWLATLDGWLHYRPLLDVWERGTLPGRVQTLGTDPVNPVRGIWFRTSSGWYVQPRSGGPAVPDTPPSTLRLATTVEDAMRDMPQLRSFAPTITVGPRLTTGRLTTAAPIANGSGWYLGTSSRGLVAFDRLGAVAESFQVGIPGEVIGALAASDEGVWVATDATTDIGAQLTLLSHDLTQSHSVAGLPTAGLPFDAARRLLVTDRALWVGSDRGAVRVALPSGEFKRFDEGSGLTDQRVTSLVERQGHVVIGTLRGLSEEVSPGVVQRRASKYFGAVYALAARGDTIWVGTSVGLAALLPGEEDLKIPDGLRAMIGGNAPVYGVGYVADTLVTMTTDRLLWRDPASGAWSWGPLLTAQMGRLAVMYADDDGVWVGGVDGVALLRPNLAPLRVLHVPVDLPGPVTSISRSGGYLWLGTLRGLVRYRMETR
jgi:ligand-binding sensor domain-containing protein